MHLQLLQQRSSPVVQVLKLHCTITRHKHKLTCINAHIVVFFFNPHLTEFDKKRQVHRELDIVFFCLLCLYS